MPPIEENAGGAAMQPAIPEGIADVVVDVTNRGFLHYRVEVEGATPNFTFSCKSRDAIKRAVNFPGHPKSVYEWDFLNHPGDVDERPLDAFSLVLVFVAARKYRVQIDHRKGDGTSVPVRDETFESDDPAHIELTGIVVEIR